MCVSRDDGLKLLSHYYHSPARVRVGGQQEGPALGLVGWPVLPLVLLAAVVDDAATTAPQRGFATTQTTPPAALHCASRDLKDSYSLPSLMPIDLQTRFAGNVGGCGTCCTTKHCQAPPVAAPPSRTSPHCDPGGEHLLPRRTPSQSRSCVNRACCVCVCGRRGEGRRCWRECGRREVVPAAL